MGGRPQERFDSCREGQTPCQFCLAASGASGGATGGSGPENSPIGNREVLARFPVASTEALTVVEGFGISFESLINSLFWLVFHELDTDFNAADQFFGYFYGNLDRDGFHRFLYAHRCVGCLCASHPFNSSGVCHSILRPVSTKNASCNSFHSAAVNIWFDGPP